MFTHSKMEVTNGFISFDHIFIVQKISNNSWDYAQITYLELPSPIRFICTYHYCTNRGKKKLLQMSRYKNIQNGNRDKRCKRLCLLSIYEC